MPALKISFFSANEDGSETIADQICVEQNSSGEFSMQDRAITVHGETLYFGISVVKNGNMHIGLMDRPFFGVKGPLYGQIVADCMARFGGPPSQLIGRLKSGKLVRCIIQPSKEPNQPPEPMPLKRYGSS